MCFFVFTAPVVTFSTQGVLGIWTDMALGSQGHPPLDAQDGGLVQETAPEMTG